MPGSDARIAGKKGWLPAEMKLEKRKRNGPKAKKKRQGAGRLSPLLFSPGIRMNGFRNSFAFHCPAVAMIPEQLSNWGKVRERKRRPGCGSEEEAHIQGEAFGSKGRT